MSTLNFAEDRALVEKAIRFDRLAMQQIVERHQERVYRLAYRLAGDIETARDVAQETFLKAFENLRGMRDGQALSQWLCQIATNLIRDRWKGRKETVQFDEEDPRLPGATSDPGRELEAREVADRIQTALMALPAIYREAFVLRYVEELGCEEISGLLGVKLSAVKVRIHRACRMLRKLLPEFAMSGGDEG
jgi:RNA polymerase sigma-70 factor (ECF subfamily)